MTGNTSPYTGRPKICQPKLVLNKKCPSSRTKEQRNNKRPKTSKGFFFGCFSTPFSHRRRRSPRGIKQILCPILATPARQSHSGASRRGILHKIPWLFFWNKYGPPTIQNTSRVFQPRDTRPFRTNVRSGAVGLFKTSHSNKIWLSTIH